MATFDHNPNDKSDPDPDSLFMPAPSGPNFTETSESLFMSPPPADERVTENRHDNPTISTANEDAEEKASEAAATTAPTATLAPYLPAFPPTNAIMLDPNNSERRYYRDPLSQVQREIWRPGDDDGDHTADYFEKPGAIPLEKRWRFYQSSPNPDPIVRGLNEPPRYVVLDDQAAYEVLMSNIPRQLIVRYWSHDFGGNGRVRMRRSHRGRGALIADSAASDDGNEAASPSQNDERVKFHSTNSGPKFVNAYYFTGEKNYRPIHYVDPTSQSTQMLLEEATEDDQAGAQWRKRKASNELIASSSSSQLIRKTIEQEDQFVTPKDRDQKKQCTSSERLKSLENSKSSGGDDPSLDVDQNSETPLGQNTLEDQQSGHSPPDLFLQFLEMCRDEAGLLATDAPCHERPSIEGELDAKEWCVQEDGEDNVEDTNSRSAGVLPFHEDSDTNVSMGQEKSECLPQEVDTTFPTSIKGLGSFHGLSENSSVIDHWEKQHAEDQKTIQRQKMIIANLERQVHILKQDVQTARNSAGKSQA